MSSEGRGPLIGWRWKRWARPPVSCVRCNRKITRGLVNIRNADPSHEAFRAMCPGCVQLTFAEVPPESWATPEWKADA